ncbi:MAG TPA: sulfurtransferase [Candidatus Limnocylindria bacterium]
MGELLVDPAWLVAHHRDAEVRIVDPRSPEDYATGHVPGAVNANTAYKDPDRPLHVMPPEQAEAAIRALGISDDSSVVIVDNGMLAGRAWWFLTYHGHPDVRIVDGGFDAYRDAGGPLTTDAPAIVAGSFHARVQPQLIARADDVRRAIGGDARILDVRSDQEWRGSNRMSHRRVGRIPGARHLLWELVLGTEPPHRFRSPDEIRAVAAERGVAPSDRVITVCEVGWRAAHTAFALRLAGFSDVRVYDASMREWDNDLALPLDPPAQD